VRGHGSRDSPAVAPCMNVGRPGNGGRPGRVGSAGSAIRDIDLASAGLTVSPLSGAVTAATGEQRTGPSGYGHRSDTRLACLVFLIAMRVAR